MNLRSAMKQTLTAVVLAAALLAVPAVAWADEVNVQGYTSGIFDSPTGTNTLYGLTYNSSTFNVTTVGGYAGIGSAPGTININNLGSFELAGGLPLAIYTGHTFELTITFTVPTDIQSGQTVVQAALIGRVFEDSGGVRINFDNTPKTVTFLNGTSTGSFNLTVNDVSVSPNYTVAATGYISGGQQTPSGTSTPVPEPATLSLLGISMIAAGIVGRRQKRKAIRK